MCEITNWNHLEFEIVIEMLKSVKGIWSLNEFEREQKFNLKCRQLIPCGLDTQ